MLSSAGWLDALRDNAEEYACIQAKYTNMMQRDHRVSQKHRHIDPCFRHRQPAYTRVPVRSEVDRTLTKIE
jgi:hypothetical protein